VPAWQPIDANEEREGALSLGLCPDDPQTRYLGASDGLYRWDKTTEKWVQINQAGNQPVPGNVRDVLVSGNNCKDVFAAALDNGLWQIEGTTATYISTDVTPPVRSVSRRGDLLFAGTNGGILVYDKEKKEWPDIQTGVVNLITRQSEAEGRIYAALWGTGVAYNDTCAANSCPWVSIPALPNHIYVRDVLGSPADQQDQWILIATSAGVAYWAGGEWYEPLQPPQPAGNVFALAISPDGKAVFAAVEQGGVWYSQDKGRTWFELDALPYPIIDLTTASDGLYTTTTNNGVWRYSFHTNASDN
jgi:hypothetical protein